MYREVTLLSSGQDQAVYQLVKLNTDPVMRLVQSRPYIRRSLSVSTCIETRKQVSVSQESVAQLLKEYGVSNLECSLPGTRAPSC